LIYEVLDKCPTRTPQSPTIMKNGLNVEMINISDRFFLNKNNVTRTYRIQRATWRQTRQTC